MERLIITDKIQDIAINYCNDVINRFGGRIEKNLMNLRHKILGGKDSSNYVFYINLLNNYIKSVILLTPLFFEDPLVGVLNFNDIIDFSKMFESANAGTKYKTGKFADEIVDALCYNEIRSEIIPTYVKQLGIRTCVYCNANWAITFEDDADSKKIARGYYEIDHLKPKSLYPHLCISFFNLQPSCGGCNRTKSKNSSLFNLYVENGRNVELNPFIFELEKTSLLKYYINKNDNHIAVLFKGKSGHESLVRNHNTMFHIEKLYQEFNPEVEELVWKFKVYNKVYIEIFVNLFKSLFPGKGKSINRFLYGFYESEKDIHKRPLTKLHQDIFAQLKRLNKQLKNNPPYESKNFI